MSWSDVIAPERDELADRAMKPSSPATPTAVSRVKRRGVPPVAAFKTSPFSTSPSTAPYTLLLPCGLIVRACASAVTCNLGCNKGGVCRGRRPTPEIISGDRLTDMRTPELSRTFFHAGGWQAASLFNVWDLLRIHFPQNP